MKEEGLRRKINGKNIKINQQRFLFDLSGGSEEERLNVHLDLFVHFAHQSQTSLRFEEKLFLRNFDHVRFCVHKIDVEFVLALMVIIVNRWLLNICWHFQRDDHFDFLESLCLCWLCFGQVDRRHLLLNWFCRFFQHIWLELFFLCEHDFRLELLFQRFVSVLYHVFGSVSSEQHRYFWPFFPHLNYMLDHFDVFFRAPRFMRNNWIQVVVPMLSALLGLPEVLLVAFQEKKFGDFIPFAFKLRISAI